MLQSIRMAWEAIRANKMRSFLTMLGIIIGVTALVVMVSMVQGVAGLITDQVSALGSDMLTVSIVDDKGAPLRLEDLAALGELPGVDRVSPSGSMGATAKYGVADAQVVMYGVTPAYAEIEGLTLGSGRFLTSADVDNRSYVAVLAAKTAVELFGGEDALGRRVTMDGRAFEVVGVLAAEDSMMPDMMGGLGVYVPFTVESRMAGQPYAATFVASALGDADAAEAGLTGALLARLQQDEDAFSVVNMSAIASAMDTITGALSLLLGGIAAISLLVGGIGIMNIMLVSVTERTREIGIRKAIGANRRSIMLQFLVEALMVSLLGCLIGLALSAGLLLIVSTAAPQMTFAMSGKVVALAVGFSSGVGLLFGLYPAGRAAGKQPVEALRCEG
ncbi:MAG: ABC transporter permease [Aristaeellaceae bacterium]